MDNYSKYSDEYLFVLVQNKNKCAFSELYKRFWGILYEHARKMLRDDQEAGDIVQETMLVLWEKAKAIELKTTLSAMLYSTMRNKIITLINREKYKAAYLKSLEASLGEGCWQTDEHVREHELASLIEDEIAKLPPKMREIFELSRKTYLDYKTIASETGLSEGTIKKQIYNALKKLRFKLSSLLLIHLMSILYYISKFY